MASGSTSIPNEWTSSFPSVPPLYVEELYSNFADQIEAWYVRDWEKVGMKAGKIAEIVYSIIEGEGAGRYEAAPFKPKNFLAACTAIESKYASMSRSLRIQIPRVLIGIYELRNNRSVGHVGSPVNPNALDGEFFFRGTKWVVCELSRALCEERNVFGVEGFYSEVNASELPLIWEQSGILRVLRPDYSAADKTIVVLAHNSKWIEVAELCSYVEYSKLSMYKTRVLDKLHEQKLIEYDRPNSRAIILPAGMRRARELHK